MLELLGVWVLKAPTRGDVGVVHDNVGVWDVFGVVVVVDDGYLMVAEVLARPGDRELAEGVQLHMVFGVRREHVVLVGAAGPVSPGCVVSPAGARAVHGGGPVEGGVLAVGDVEFQVVGGERAPVLGEVTVDALAGRMAGYGLEQRHSSHLQKEQARLCYLAHGGGEFARPLAQALQLLLDRGELLQGVGCVHGLAPEVVGDAVQGVGRLTLLVAPLVELAAEAVGSGEVEHHVAVPTSSAGSCRSSLKRTDAVMFSTSTSVCARSTSASLTRTCRRLSNLSMIPPRHREVARLARTVVRASRGRGASPPGSVSRAPVARHLGGATRH